MTGERLIVVPGKETRSTKKYRADDSRGRQVEVRDLSGTVVFWVPEEFVDAWRRNEP